jgi:MFS family permease
VLGGPVVGGAVTEGIAWQWIFWLNVPIGLVTILLVPRRIEESFGPKTALDIPGLALATGAALGIVWGLVRGNAAGWGSAEVVGTLAAGVLLLGAFVGWERRAPAPMVPMRLFRSRAFSAGNAVSFFTTASLFAAVFFFAQLLEVGLGYSPLDTGLRLVTWTITFITVAPLAGTMADRVGVRPLIVGGLSLQAVGLAWLALTVSTDTSYAELIGPFLLSGAGVSMAIPGMQTAVMTSVSADAIGKAAGTNSMMRQLGGVLGIAVTVAVFAGAGSYASPSAFLDGFVPAAVVTGGLALAGVVCGLALPGRRTAAGPSFRSIPQTAEAEV